MIPPIQRRKFARPLPRPSKHPVYEISGQEILESFGDPPLESKEELRYMMRVLFPQIPSSQLVLSSLDAVAAGLHFETKRLLTTDRNRRVSSQANCLHHLKTTSWLDHSHISGARIISPEKSFLLFLNIPAISSRSAAGHRSSLQDPEPLFRVPDPLHRSQTFQTSSRLSLDQAG